MTINLPADRGRILESMGQELKGRNNQDYLDYLLERSKAIPNKSYTIKSGDTLSQIAKATGTTLAALKRANPDIKDLNKIRVGQKIKISAPVSNRKSVYQGLTKPEMAAIHITPKLDVKPPKKKPPIPKKNPNVKAGLGAFTPKKKKMPDPDLALEEMLRKMHDSNLSLKKRSKGSTAQNIKPRGWGKARYNGK